MRVQIDLIRYLMLTLKMVIELMVVVQMMMRGVRIVQITWRIFCTPLPTDLLPLVGEILVLALENIKVTDFVRMKR